MLQCADDGQSKTAVQGCTFCLFHTAWSDQSYTHCDVGYGGDIGEGRRSQSGCGLAEAGSNISGTQRPAVTSSALKTATKITTINITCAHTFVYTCICTCTGSNTRNVRVIPLKTVHLILADCFERFRLELLHVYMYIYCTTCLYIIQWTCTCSWGEPEQASTSLAVQCLLCQCIASSCSSHGGPTCYVQT